MFRVVVELLVDRLCLLRVLAGEHPVACLLCDPRSLEVRTGDDARVVHRPRELDRALDVLARRLVVGLPPAAPGAPRENPRTEEVARQPRPVGELERLVEQRDRGGNAGDPIAAAAEPEQDVRPVDVREDRELRELSRRLEDLDRLTRGTELLEGPALARQGTKLELGRAEARDGRARLAEGIDGLLVAVRL